MSLLVGLTSMSPDSDTPLMRCKAPACQFTVTTLAMCRLMLPTPFSAFVTTGTHLVRGGDGY